MEPPQEDPRKRKLEHDPDSKDGVEAGEDVKRSRSAKWLVTKDAHPTNQGEVVDLVANCFRVDFSNPDSLFIFHMHMEPAAGVFVKRSVLAANREAIGRYEFWGEILFVKKDLSGQTFKADVNGAEYSLTLSVPIPPDSSDVAAPGRMAMFSRLLKTTFAKMKYIRIRDSVYDPNQSISYRDMVAMRGFSTNVDLFQGGMMLNLDVSFKWIQTRTILDMMAQARERAKQAQLVENQIVLTNYADRRGDRRFYRVAKIDWDKTPMSTFPRRKRREHKYAEAEEEMVSFRDYYAQTHNLTIRELRQPLLMVIEKRRRPTDGVQVEETLYLVPELCVLAGMTEAMRTDGGARRDIMKLTGTSPTDRMRNLESIVDKLQPGRLVPDKLKPGELIDPGAGLAEWGLRIDSRPLELKGRIIPREPLFIGSRDRKSRVIPGDKTEWRDLFGAPPTQRGAPPAANGPGLFMPVSIANWAIFCTPRHEADVENMLNAYKTVTPELKLDIQKPEIFVVKEVGAYPEKMRSVYAESVTRGKPFALFQVVLDGPRAENYNNVKLVMTDKPVLIQCVQARTIKPSPGIESKCKGLLQQIVCKLGGSPWALRINPFSKEPTMIVGIDVSHAKVTQRGSVVALTATINDTYTRYFSDVYQQGPGQEMSTGIAACFEKALNAFGAANRCGPKHIVVYRDDPGGRGALDALMENEIDMMLAVLKRMRSEAGLAVIVVRKRGLMRLFRRRDRANPPPGTMVDTTIVSRDYNDFYLVAHSSRAGTVKPTQYQIVYRTEGDNTLNTANIQYLSYMLCHLYYNFMGTIAEPAPLRYADRLANLVRQTLSDNMPREELSNRLYYL